MNLPSKTKVRRKLGIFAVELVIYSGLVTVYFLVVLHFLSDWLVQLETGHVHTYAVVSILLIIGQAAVLEAVTTGLLRLLRRAFRR